MQAYYLDTSIWLDHYEKRGMNGKNAFKLILKIIEEDSLIIYSDFHIRELKHLGYDINEIYAIIKIAKPGNIKKVQINRNQSEEAKQLASLKNIPRGDALHAILARDNNAIMITRDQDFLKLSHIVEVRQPEDLL